MKFNATTNQACCGMICKNENHSSYLYYYLIVNQDEIANMAIGGAQNNLSKTMIEELPILKPDNNILGSPSFKTIIGKREKITRENQSLNSVKNLLLSKMAKG